MGRIYIKIYVGNGINTMKENNSFTAVSDVRHLENYQAGDVNFRECAKNENWYKILQINVIKA